MFIAVVLIIVALVSAIATALVVSAINHAHYTMKLNALKASQHLEKSVWFAHGFDDGRKYEQTEFEIAQIKAGNRIP